MLTGLYPHAHGLTENNGHFGGAKSLPQDAWHIGLAFAEQGYNIGWFSKWHLSEDGTMRDHGFDGFSLPDYGYPYGK
jgi:arylsulfatase A-like enzyme